MRAYAAADAVGGHRGRIYFARRAPMTARNASGCENRPGQNSKNVLQFPRPRVSEAGAPSSPGNFPRTGRGSGVGAGQTDARDIQPGLPPPAVVYQGTRPLTDGYLRPNVSYFCAKRGQKPIG